MRRRKVLLVFRKDWREISRNWQILLPIAVIPLIFTVLLPVLMTALPEMNALSTPSAAWIEPMIENLPAEAQARLAGLADAEVMTYMMLLYFFAPFFLIIPLMASSVIASDSFAGEKERETIEALLATPMTDGELLMGKVLVSFVPSMGVTVISFAIYSAIVDALTYGTFGALLLPNLPWTLLIFGLSPAVAIAGIGITVIISSRVKGFREAQQISAALVIPILMLLLAQASGALIFGPVVIVSLIALLAVVDYLLIRLGVRLFRRDEILTKRG